MSSADAADYGFKRFRVARACVVCRLRKTKCNGEQPCDRCKAHSAECKYETIEAPVPKRAGRSNSSLPSNATARTSRREGTEDGDSDHDSPPDSAAQARAAKRQKRAMIDQIADRRWGDRQQSRSSGSRKSGYVIHHLDLYASIDQDEPTEQDTELHTEDGIRAHDQNTGNMQFYGFTSNFNFQHRLAQTIEALQLREQYVLNSSNSSRGSNGAADGAPGSRSMNRRSSHLPESMKIWGHQDIIFRANLSEKSFPTLDASNHAVGDSTFLPPSIVDRFIENYMTLIQPQLGVVPKRQILKWVKTAKAQGYLSRGFFGAPASGMGAQSNSQTVQRAGPAPIRTNELAALYVVLALGALMDEGDWEDVHAPVPMTREGAIACATTLFLLAKKRLEEIVENSSIQSARCLVLMAFFSLQWSSPNVAYLYIGYAARMCISIGLHRETFYSASNPKSVEHRQLWWTCYGTERMISTYFGQASAIRDDDVSVRMPPAENSHDAYLLVYAQITRVCSEVSRLSANPPANAHDVLLAAERMEAEMLRIRQDAPRELAVGLGDGFCRDADDDSDSSDLVVRRYSVTTLWWYLRLLIHAPLVIFALYCRSIGTDIPRSVLDKTHSSARAGQQIIDAISNARSDIPRPGLDNMRFGSFYLDSACTIVLAAILCDPSNQEKAFEYLAAIDRAIKYLEKKERIYADHGTTASLHKARDLVVLARQVVRAAAGQSASARVSENNAARAKGSVGGVHSWTGGGSGSAAAEASARPSHLSNGRLGSTFSTSSERGTAAAGDHDGADNTLMQSGAQDGVSGSEHRGERSGSNDLGPSAFLGQSNLALRSQSSPAIEPDGNRTYATERDEWMQYFLSNFDWLAPGSQPASQMGHHHGVQTPNMDMAIDMTTPSMGGGPGRGYAGSVISRGGVSMHSPALSSPGSYSGPASLSELDIGLLMGGVSVMEGINDRPAGGGGSQGGSGGGGVEMQTTDSGFTM